MKTTGWFLVMTVASSCAAGLAIGCSSSSGAGPGGGGGDAGHDALGAADTGASADTGSAADSGSGDSGSSDSGSVVLSDAGCIVVVNNGPFVQQKNVATDPPTPKGGTIPDGTYYCTAAAQYTGPDGGTGTTGNTVQSTSTISGGGKDYALVIGVGTGASFTNGTLTISGPDVAFTQTCPTHAVSPYDRFDSDGTTVVLYTSTPPITSLTYTRQ
jgi:hypothetical protein